MKKNPYINKKFILSDLTIILKVRPKVCVQRMAKEKFSLTLFEKEEKLRRVWQNYQTFPKKFRNVIIVNGEGSVEEVFSQVKTIVRSKLNL